MKLRLLAGACALVLFTSCAGLVDGVPLLTAHLKYQRFTADYPGLFDSYVTVTGYAKTRGQFDRYAKNIYDRLYRLHKLYDIYNDYDGLNNLKTINDNAGIAPVSVDNDIIGLLEYGIGAYEKTNGAVNIAMGPILKIWHDYREEAARPGGKPELPQLSELQAAAKNTDINDIVIENGTVFLKKTGMSLDVGAIAKGFAADMLLMENYDIDMKPLLINIGGNVVTLEPPPEGGRQSWAVGLQDPSEPGEIMDTVYVNHTSVVTSGDYQRFYTVDGKRYGHIIDPLTLMPAERCASVTVICRESAAADMLSTSLFILSREEGEKQLKRYKAEAIWVYHDGSTKETPGFNEYRQLEAAHNTLIV